MKNNGNQPKKNVTTGTIAVFAICFLLAVFFPGLFREEKQGNTVQKEGSSIEQQTEPQYTFRTDKLLKEHYEKHGVEMGFASAGDYLEAANAVLQNPDVLHKTEAEDGDDVYYLEATNEFVVVSTDGYIRTYFYPDAGIDYFNRQ